MAGFGPHQHGDSHPQRHDVERRVQHRDDEGEQIPLMVVDQVVEHDDPREQKRAQRDGHAVECDPQFRMSGGPDSITGHRQHRCHSEDGEQQVEGVGQRREGVLVQPAFAHQPHQVAA
jgi:hypothetical protein